MKAKPKYLKIKEELLEEIQAGKFKPGAQFYTEKEMVERFQVSSITVLRAVQELVQERYLNRVQGSGTFVRRELPDRVIKFTELLNAPNSPVQKLVRNQDEKTVVLSIQVIQSAAIAERLQIDVNAPIVHFKRIRKLGHEIWSLQNNYIPKSTLSDLTFDKEEDYSALTDKLAEALGLDLRNAKFSEDISVQYPQPDYVSYLFGTEKHEPVYHFTRVTYTPETSYNVFEFVETYVRWNYYSIKITR
ncbi:GntR family transcriptional regulator [Lacticaseibacillus daqingensis]|uniref:GntR family transcriptional regulator n=1 Tax=Lacticaseibacillus daqingensis TaxID=2486014 RepID=UPI000F7766C1|nr:GntR family transcriptional regulator [Lacticaseibacillus daqingensis]